MIKRQTLRFISLQFSGYDRHSAFTNSGLMASLLSKDPFFTGFCGFTQSATASEGRPRFSRKCSYADVGINTSFQLNLKGCSDHCDGYRRWHDDRLQGQKPRALAPYPQLIHKSDAHVEDKKGAKIINGQGIFKHGSPLGFPEHVVADKLIVAVDVDEVLGNFVSALNLFIADRYSSKHSVSEYHVYEFFKIWNCSRDEADIRVHEFFKTSYFKTGIHPIPGARAALHKLSTFCNLSVVTSRQNAIRDHTIEWIEKYYPGLFQEIHFGNHFALDGKSRPKSDICRSLGAHVLIDDNPRYAIECADVGIRVLLFDYENSYPWSKTGSTTQHPLITKVHNWQEVEQQLVSWITS